MKVLSQNRVLTLTQLTRPKFPRVGTLDIKEKRMSWQSMNWRNTMKRI